MKTLTIAALSITMLAHPRAAYAQVAGSGSSRVEPAVDPAKKDAADRAYGETLSKVPPKEYDPWQSVREKAPAEKPSAQKKKPPRPSSQ